MAHLKVAQMSQEKSMRWHGTEYTRIRILVHPLRRHDLSLLRANPALVLYVEVCDLDVFDRVARNP
jgi:hypothetical protein